MKYLKKFESHSQYESYIATDYAKPNVSYCVTEGDVHYNPKTWADEYLTFVALENSTFQLATNAVNYSLDNGKTWTELAANTSSPTVTTGNKIMWKGELTPNSSYGIGIFSSSGRFNVEGNAMSLLYGDNFKGQTDLVGKNNAFYRLFDGNTNVINAKNLSLPATTLAKSCYRIMFQRCSGLITAPALPATTLADYCYYNMFSVCTSLETTPELQATTLNQYCYYGMFNGCTGLTTAPELPAITLASNCYAVIFSGCTNLNYIKAMFTTTPGTSYTRNWVSGVAATGTFVKNSAAQWDVSGVNGIPNGWTVETASA